MTEPTQPVPRNRVLKAAQEEMLRFEQKENDFRKHDRKERAAELHLPLNNRNVLKIFELSLPEDV